MPQMLAGDASVLVLLALLGVLRARDCGLHARLYLLFALALLLLSSFRMNCVNMLADL